MQQAEVNRAFFVKVEGQSHSAHRSPQGVYRVEVINERTLAHSACAALSVARGSVPFLDENLDSFTLKAFCEDGQEISIPRSLHTSHEDRGMFCGRAVNYPDSISLQ